MDATVLMLKELLLSMAAAQNVDALLRRITGGLADVPGVALARIWLLTPGDDAHLHLVSSAGRPLAADADWSRTDGAFRRFPVGEGKIGRLVTDGALVVDDITGDPRVRVPAWAEAERIRGFGGVPLAYQDETLGALGVFMRTPFIDDGLDWLKLLGDHASAAIANARAFEEIARLKQQLEHENAYLREEAATFGELVGASDALRQVLEAVETVGPTDATVLITGESGTGKELVARAIHDGSARRERTLVKVNCASVPRDLFESEFFGHVRGAFTGAVKDRAGRFLLADGGTLFLDEVGEIPLEMQSKLLRVLQESEYERIGEERTTRVDVRIIAATNRDLLADVKAGTFREDLYYRLAVFPIEVAPLRERREDVPLLARHFIRRAAPKLKRPVLPLTDEAAALLSAYDWPGNVRELQNVVERAVILSKDGPLRIAPPAPPHRVPSASDEAVLTEAALKQLERDNIVRALERCDWQVAGDDGAASLLGMKPSTLSSRIKKYAIRRP